MTTLAAAALSVRFGHGNRGLTAVDGVDLEVPAGATVGLVGESGSGKSTLARALSGLTPLAEGDVLLDGTPVPKRQGGRAVDRGRRVQMIFQDPFTSLNPRMTVGEAIGEASALRGGARRGARGAEVEHCLGLVHLDPELAGRLPSRLSGGQRQRVAIARALAARPEVLIADEITSSLDVSVQSAVLNLMRELRAELGISMMFVSHNLATVRYVERHDRGHVPRADRRGGADGRRCRGAAASVHAGVARCGAASRFDRTRGSRARRPAGSAPSTAGLSLSSALPDRPNGRSRASDLHRA